MDSTSRFRIVALAVLTTACSSTRPAATLHGVGGTIRVSGDLALSLSAPDGSLVLRTSRSHRSVAGIDYAGIGYSTEPEPELAPPSFGDYVPVPLPEASTRHHATRVLSTHSTATGVQVLFATDDPTGRTLTLALDGGADDTFRATVTPSDPSGVSSMFATFDLAAAETIHGFGGRRESTNLRGLEFANWVFDYRFPDVSSTYYAPIPMLVSSAGYGAWLETSRNAYVRVGTSPSDVWRVAVAGAELRLHLTSGSLSELMSRMSARAGRNRVAPEWSMGATLSRTVRVLVDTPASYQAKVADDVAHIVSGTLPVSAYAYEGWVQLPPSFVTSTNAMLDAAGVHPVLYLRSFLSNDAAGTEPYGRIDEAIAGGYVPRRADGSPYTFRSPFGAADAVVVDFTNPAARTWWKGLVKALLDTGADGFMNDFGEQVEDGMVFFDGSTGATMHNRYPTLQHEATREAVDEYEIAHPGREIYFFGRAGYTGSAAHLDASFPGDETVDFDALTGLPSIVPDMLNRAVLGSYGFTTDIGGYADFYGQTLDAELFTRWTEASVFTTHFRVHNSALGGVKMPWDFDAQTEASFVEMAALHARAVPLLRSLWSDAVATGIPPVRPLYSLDPSDEGEAASDHEWLVGDDILVAPVLERGASSRSVRFPPGCWQLHGVGDSTMGPSTTIVAAPVGTLPWFVRCGTTPLPP